MSRLEIGETEPAGNGFAASPNDAIPSAVDGARCLCEPPASAGEVALRRLSSAGASPREEPTYGWPFWLAYLSNSCMMLAISLLFRYADFVRLHGGGEYELGWILGVGMVGGLLMRFAQAGGIDRFGAGRVWFWSTVAFAAICWLHTLIGNVHGPAVYVLRVAYCICIAGIFGASTTYISLRAPVVRVAEVIGTLGTSGFIGMMGGTLLGDLIFRGDDLTASVEAMFLCSAGLSLASAAFCALATRGRDLVRRRRRAPLWALIRRYQPGALLLVGVAVGFGAGIPQNFLRPYTKELGIAGMAVYFWVYAPMAFAVRLGIRGLPERAGIRPMIFAGLSLLSLSMLLYLMVFNEWMLSVPAIVAGAAHALLFPAVVGGGSTAFPARHRGLGVTLMFAMMDLGLLIGSPLAGLILEGARRTGMAPYGVMFCAVAAFLALVCAYYLLMSHPHKNGRAAAGKFGDVTRPRMKRLASVVAGIPGDKPSIDTAPPGIQRTEPCVGGAATAALHEGCVAAKSAS